MFRCECSFKIEKLSGFFLRIAREISCSYDFNINKSNIKWKISDDSFDYFKKLI